MPIEKQSLNNFLPDGFETLNQEGYKENFNEDKIKTGYEKDVPDIVSGPNLNNLIDVVGKNTNTLNNYVEYLNGMPINNVPTVNTNGQLDYMNLDDKLTKKQITNCILEIPQRIKYTLENGILTIKAGSVVIVPYGVEDLTAQYPVGSVFIHENFRVYDTQYEDGKFFVWAEVQNDIVSRTSGETEETLQYMFIDITQNITAWQRNTESGTSATASRKYTAYYNTESNLVGMCHDSTTNEYLYLRSFIFLTATNTTSNSWKSVNQVFNGFGYIGSTIWVDKGVKVLRPNGRNVDGTLKNLEQSTQNLLTINVSGLSPNLHNYYFYLNIAGQAVGYTRFLNPCDKLNELPMEVPDQYTWMIYCAETNHIYITNGSTTANWTINDRSFLGLLNGSGTQIQDFKPFETINLLMRNDSSEISGWGMPSNKYIDLTLGSSGATYTAPANGWFNISGLGTSSNLGYIFMWCEETSIRMEAPCSSGLGVNLSLPVKKGDIMRVTYAFLKNDAVLRFTYAKGEV